MPAATTPPPAPRGGRARSRRDRPGAPLALASRRSRGCGPVRAPVLTDQQERGAACCFARLQSTSAAKAVGSRRNARRARPRPPTCPPPTKGGDTPPRTPTPPPGGVNCSRLKGGHFLAPVDSRKRTSPRGSPGSSSSDGCRSRASACLLAIGSSVWELQGTGSVFAAPSACKNRGEPKTIPKDGGDPISSRRDPHCRETTAISAGAGES